MRALAVLIVLAMLGASAAVAGLSLRDVEILEDNGDSLLVRAGGRTGTLYRRFSHGFEATELRDWFGEGAFSTMTLHSPAVPEIADYVALQREIRAGRADFLDNRITPERREVFAGAGAARFEVVDPDGRLVTSKASISANQMWFIRGDDLWFQASYFLAEGVPFALADFEDRERRKSPGPRIVIWGGAYLGVEMKHRFKPRLKQTLAEVPRGRWFTLKLHMVLDERAGRVRLWQDGRLIIDGMMRTLPHRDAILTGAEIGITASDMAATLLVDEVSLSHEAP